MHLNIIGIYSGHSPSGSVHCPPTGVTARPVHPGGAWKRARFPIHRVEQGQRNYGVKKTHHVLTLFWAEKLAYRK